MGYLIYGNAAEYEIEDRALAHLKVAVGYKLRRQESFFISWTVPVEKGGGRFSVWVSPNVPIVFKFAGSRPPEINQTWVTVLRQLSGTQRGLVLVTEKEAEEFARTNPITQEVE